MLALELLQYIKGNMEGVGTVSVPFHISQLTEAIAELEHLETENKQLKKTIKLLKQCDDSSTEVIGKMDTEIVRLKTQMLPNELEQNMLEAMDKGKTDDQKTNKS